MNLKCRGGLWMVDVSTPTRPQDAGWYVTPATLLLPKTTNIPVQRK